jgi:hypothetical protein
MRTGRRKAALILTDETIGRIRRVSQLTERPFSDTPAPPATAAARAQIVGNRVRSESCRRASIRDASQRVFRRVAWKCSRAEHVVHIGVIGPVEHVETSNIGSNDAARPARNFRLRRASTVTCHEPGVDAR